MSRGKRESQWLVIRRCLAIVRRAQRGAAGRDELIQAVLMQEGHDAYGGVEGEALLKRFENDLRHVRDDMLVNLYYDRQLGSYTIRDVWLPLLDLPDEDLETIAWLEGTFDMGSPQHDAVHALLGRLRSYLGPERLAVVERSRTALTVDLRQRDEDELRPAVWEDLNRALLSRRRVEFLYLSPQYEDEQPRRHVVDPCRLYFDTTRGHYYLRAYCRRIEGPQGLETCARYLTYRVGRVLELTVLPQKLLLLPSVPRYRVEYELTPEVARMGITHQREIEVHDVEQREDGSALVRGETGNLFFAVRSLLHYGPNCRVVGGPEMVREMRSVVRALAAVYDEQRVK